MDCCPDCTAEECCAEVCAEIEIVLGDADGFDLTELMELVQRVVAFMKMLMTLFQPSR